MAGTQVHRWRAGLRLRTQQGQSVAVHAAVCTRDYKLKARQTGRCTWPRGAGFMVTVIPLLFGIARPIPIEWKQTEPNAVGIARVGMSFCDFSNVFLKNLYPFAFL